MAYRYIVADLLTNTTLAELPFTNVNFTQQLNSAGTFTGSLLPSGISTIIPNLDAATTPARTALYVDKDGVIIWGGIIWLRRYTSNNQQLEITAREFISYFERRRITNTITFAGTDQLRAAATLITNAQGATNGNIGVIVPDLQSNVTINRTIYAYEYKPVFTAIQELSQAANGFEFSIEVNYDGGGTPTKTLQLGYPRLGTILDPNNPAALAFNFPSGNISQYEYPEDGSNAVNQLWAIGAGSNEGQTSRSAIDTDKLTYGWPLLQDAINYTDVADQSLLSNLAAGHIAARAYPPVTLKIVVPGSVTPAIGTYNIGDDARITITDDRFPQTLDAIYRIVALNITPGELGPEQATITLTLPNS